MRTTSRAQTMQVIACSADGTTRQEQRAVPKVGPGEVLLRLRVCGLCGTDLFKLTQRSAPAGTVLGHELVGEVVECGEGVDSFACGDRMVVPHHVACGECGLCRRGSETLCPVFRENLMTPGGFSDYVLVGERAVAQAARRVPEHVPDEAAVFLEPAACVLRGLKASGLQAVPVDLQPPACAVILGAGSMGLLHLLVLRAWRPYLQVVVCDPIEERRELASRLGAHEACAPDDAALRSLVDARTDGLGADVVFDTVGGTPLLRSAVAMLREGGTALLFAHAPPGDVADVELNNLFHHERVVRGSYSGALSDQLEVFELIVARRLDASSLVTHRLPLSQFSEAVEVSRRQAALKVLLVPDVESTE